MHPLGPFEVSADQVARLGATFFTPMINSLLAAEGASHKLSGHQLRLDHQETADGGVDAQILGAASTRWIPAGDSAWQFKAGDLEPAKCRAEIKGAQFAREMISSGAAYRLVLGARLTPDKINRRRNALLEELSKLQIAVDPDAVHVLDANALARWFSEYPALAASPALGGIGLGRKTTGAGPHRSFTSTPG